jgi:hypothetical protein
MTERSSTWAAAGSNKRKGWALGWVLNNRRRPLMAGFVLVMLVLGFPYVVMAAQGGPTGFLEICKQADGPAVAGDFEFTMAGRSVVVPVGACSAAIELPAEPTTITEVAVDGVSVTDVHAAPSDRLIGRDLATRTAAVTIVAGDVSSQTTVTFSNHAELSPLKICKVAGPGVVVGTDFTFSAGSVVATVPAGPAPGGYCTVVGSFPVAARLSVSEVVPRGLEVAAISVAPPARLVGAANPSGGSVVVRIGPGVTETTFTNQATPAAVAPTSTVPLSSAPTTTPPPLTAPATTTTVPSSGLSPTSVPPLPPATSLPPVPFVAPPPTTMPVAPPTTMPVAPPTTGIPPIPTTSVPCSGPMPTTAPPATPVVPPTTVPCSGVVAITVPPSSATTITVPPTTGPTTTLPASGVLPGTTVPPSSPTTPPFVPSPVVPPPSAPPSSPPESPPASLPESPAGVGGHQRLFPSAAPTPFPALTGRPGPGRLSQTGTDSRRNLALGVGLVVLGAALLELDRRRRRLVPALDDDFPALTFAPRVAPLGQGAKGAAQRWTAPLGRSGPNVEPGPGQRPRQAAAGVHADLLPGFEAGGNVQRLARGHEGPVVLRQVAKALRLLHRRDRGLAAIFVQAGVDRP